MSALQIKNVPSSLHEAARQRATAEGQSLNEYLLEVLRRDLAVPSPREWFERVDSREPVLNMDVARLVQAVREERDGSYPNG
ncbi:MAG: FitA-like ribbon-helix-helix domain-containing protein [Chloroflexota bacterium]